MRIKAFPPGFYNWVWSYYIIILKFDKCLTVKVFYMQKKENQECMIFIAMDIYDIGIDYLDIKFIIQ